MQGERLRRRLPERDDDGAVPGIVGLLREHECAAGDFRLQAAAAVQVHPDGVVRQPVRPAVQPGDGAGDLRRAAVAGVGEPALRRVVAETAVLGAVPAQRIGVAEPGAVGAHPGQPAVVDHLLQHVAVAGVAGEGRHPPRPHALADVGAGLGVGGGVGQLVRQPERLVHRVAPDRGAEVVRAHRAGQVELVGHHVGPDALQRLAQGRLAGLGVHIGSARPQIRRGNRVSHGGGLLPQRHAILILVAVHARIGRRTAVGHEHSRQFQIAAVAGHPVQVHQTDDLRRIEPEIGQRTRRRQEHPAQVVGQLDRDLQQGALASRLAVHGGGGEAVPDVVQLMIMHVLPTLLGRIQGDLSVQVAVRLLGGGDPADHLVHLQVQLWIAGCAVHVRHRLQPLVAVAVAPVGALVRALLQSGGDAEIGQTRLVGWILQRPAHARQDRAAAQLEAVGPEPAGPAALPERRPGHRGVGAGIVVSGMIHDSVLLRQSSAYVTAPARMRRPGSGAGASES